MAFPTGVILSALQAPLSALQAKRPGILLILSLIIASASAYDSNICCLKAARLPDVRIPLDQYPWDVCSLNDTETYAEGTTFPSVNVTMGWCRAHCPGNRQSDLSQWLQPLTSWIVPYIGLLLLCPLGDFKPPSEAYRWFWQFVGYTLEWINLLGDPTSAIFGSFSEIWSDATMLHTIDQTPEESHEPPPGKITSLSASKWVVVLVGDTEFDRRKFRENEQYTELEGGHEQTIEKQSPSLPEKTASESNRLLSSVSNEEVDDLPTDLRVRVKNAINTLIEARTHFKKAIFLPTILFLAVTASVFYDAYNKLGDNDTADWLAFGIWYSWMVILSVAANCFASSVNAGVTQTTLGQYTRLSDRSVPLRERYFNGLLWQEWLTRIHKKRRLAVPGAAKRGGLLHKQKAENSVNFEESHHAKYPFLTLRKAVELLIGHIFAWLCVAVPTACAIVVSYKTPTVGWDCRSFNFLLYGILALVVPAVHIAYQRVPYDDKKDDNNEREGYKYLKKGLKTIYWLLACANAAVLTIGTILQLAGVYRSCRCQLLFAPDSALVEVNRNTPLAVDNAKRYWLQIGYLAFGIVWVVCGVVTAARAYISARLELPDDPRKQEEQKELDDIWNQA
ncbi:uncharacterized protein PV07_02989 [Cladophialophora immunda]|uniref:Uncharacterized protein n=1 Tax=Cladophialophora immunda TaxID=569365 RepID=A0A0D2B148_9EURO|nr:uncharacterized protein PV07_02989 [Cladophialophora immunda]KIW31332.1 hypothetical protein PV07_02989 [Cladophialophora immunda]